MDPSTFLDAAGAALWHRVDALLRQGTDSPADGRTFEALALELFAWQRSRCAPIDRVARAFHGEGDVATLDAIPGVPTDAFKTARIACFDPAHTTRVFKTSGTTREVRGEHPFASTALYTRAALASGRRHLLREAHYRFVLLAEREEDAPHSSLSFMLARFEEAFRPAGVATVPVASPEPWMIDGGTVQLARVREALAGAVAAGEPVALLGATFAFVHLCDALAPSERFTLPAGSVVMPTGGFKGRSREMPQEAFFALVQDRFGVARRAIVQEYGMTELSSQGFEAPHDGVRPERYVAPPWMDVRAVDPVTLEPLPHGTQGLLRVIDLANVASCMAIQTADLGATFDDGFEVYGRAPGATPRGCARAMDALLSGG